MVARGTGADAGGVSARSPGDDRAGVIKDTALVFGRVGEPLGTRLRAALPGLTMAECSREMHKQDALPFTPGTRGGCPAVPGP